MLALIGLVWTSGGVVASPISTLMSGTTTAGSPSLSTTPFGAMILFLTAGLFLMAAASWRRLSRRGSPGDALVAIGLVFAAFAQVHAALFPTTHPEEVASGDVLMLVFDALLLAAIASEAGANLRALRAANQSLEQLRDAEVDRAALAERARLSRELHDGLAQELWLAKLKVGRLAALPDQGPEATVLNAELGSAIDSGLASAREAVMALRLASGTSDGAFIDLVRRVVDDFQDRFGLRAELESEHDLPNVPSRVGAEFLRILQEALSNVRRHADATVVRVQVLAVADRITLSVRANGKGFDMAAPRDSAFGLVSMQERAALIGGT